MSDTGRKDINTQIIEKVTPDQHKSIGERVKESVTGATDRIKGALTPDSEKSLFQQASDKARSSSDNLSRNTI